ncbi:4Fe-4S binding protein [Vibrio chagasii]|nr:4Fe-4S binding protein [Vibrio chagasii]
MPLPTDEPSVDECGKCTACITSCPTGAIIPLLMVLVDAPVFHIVIE